MPLNHFMCLSLMVLTQESHPIKTMHYEATRIIAWKLPNPDVSTFVTAPAAFIINAATIHNTFCIGADAKLPDNPLGEEKN